MKTNRKNNSVRIVVTCVILTAAILGIAAALPIFTAKATALLLVFLWALAVLLLTITSER